jgi:hypothetical protein
MNLQWKFGFPFCFVFFYGKILNIPLASLYTGILSSVTIDGTDI